MTHRIAILGASGYTGRRTGASDRHPSVDADRGAVRATARLAWPWPRCFRSLRISKLPHLQKIEDIDFLDRRSGLLRLAARHQSQAVISALPRDLKVVDLSADFRLRDPAAYEKWYGKPHAATDLQKEAVYGLTEFYREEIRAARLVAGTGCNAATGQYRHPPADRGGGDRP
jgi:N-acetyl-gamma-glutamyl-phosphate reductase